MTLISISNIHQCEVSKFSRLCYKYSPNNLALLNDYSCLGNYKERQEIPVLFLDIIDQVAIYMLILKIKDFLLGFSNTSLK